MSSEPREPPVPPLSPGSPASLTRAGPPLGGSDARERILMAAYGLFCREGIAATGIDRVVAEAGVAKMTLYRHFRSKGELARAVLGLRAELWTHGWLAYEIERRETAPEDRLLVIFDIFDEWFRREDYESCVFIKSMFESAHQDGPVAEAAARELAEIRGLLERLARDAGARDPEALAYELQMLMSGAIVLATDGDAAAAGRARAVAELLLDREGLRRGV